MVRVEHRMGEERRPPNEMVRIVRFRRVQPASAKATAVRRSFSEGGKVPPCTLIGRPGPLRLRSHNWLASFGETRRSAGGAKAVGLGNTGGKCGDDGRDVV